MVKAEKDLCCLKLIGGHLALDYSNSIWRRRTEKACEILTSYELLVQWSRQAGILCDSCAADLQAEGSRRSAEAELVLDRALTLREAIYDMFSSIAASEPPDPRALATINCELSAAICRRRIEGIPPEFTWAWSGSPTDLDQMLWPIVHSAAELLTSDDLRWIRECRAEDCDRLFVDRSRNRRRRWCSMEWCGNREKARRSLLQRHAKEDG
jgi:predicted RNA-binding Zn ribbon-like protein